MIKQLTKKETKDLEHNTTSLINVYNTKVNTHEFEFDGINASLAITSWYNTWDIKEGGLKTKRDKLTELLGFKPNYHVTYFVKHAVWGIESNGHRCVLYTSIEGTSLQVPSGFYRPGDMRKLLEPFMEKMINWDFLKSGTKQSELIKSIMSLRAWQL